MREPVTEPTAETRFELMFGKRSAACRPSHYQLILLGVDGGLDLHIPWDAMLAASFACSRHEDPFTWSAMAQDPLSVHLSLLDCAAHECLALSGRWIPGRSHASALSPQFEGATLSAFSSLPDRRPSFDIREALAANAPRVLPGSWCSPIGADLSRALRCALLAPDRDEGFVASAREALDLSGCSRPTRPAPRRPL